MQAQGEAYNAQLIDLEKTRPSLFGQRDLTKDLEPLFRRAPMWTPAEQRELLAAYLLAPVDGPAVDAWLLRLSRRGKHKQRENP